MKYQFELNEQEEQPVLSIRTRTAVENLPKVIGEAYGKIMGYMAQLGEHPAGVPYTAYYNMDMQDLDVEMGFPVAKARPGQGDVQAGAIPAGRYVTCMYKGPYSQMEEPYNEITKWMAEKGYEPLGVSYEYYYNSPEEVPESELLTKIAIAIK
ncbi:MAG: Bacterial transcription activator, effector binding domain [Pelotomaculum sp. PtaB.Bin104]|nr:MAG: Bacterial transcription activator, effector binding domain [Pelotomaculum sp. PtaB.Bin104]